MQRRRYIQVLLPLKLEWCPFYALPEGCEVQIGERVNVVFARKNYVGTVVCTEADPAASLFSESSVIDILSKASDHPRVSTEELQFWKKISSYYLCSEGEVMKSAYPASRTRMEEVEARGNERLKSKIERLKKEYESAKTDRKRRRLSEEIERLENPEEKPTCPALDIELSPAQQIAADRIREALGRGRTVLLNGVTGSGKTEIYLKLARECLLRGLSVLYLVPEIALSKQLEERVNAVFPDLMTFHSGKTMAYRRAVASALRDGKARIVLGTRSALFLPFNKLGLVIVDEEHDSSYKQSSPAPRYHARESAIMLAGIHGANVVLGSATPSVESLYNAEHKIYEKVDLKQRFYNSAEPVVEIIDTIAERRKNGMRGDFSLKLIAHIRETLSSGQQAILLRSRRSYSPAVQCRECGEIVKCPHCNVPMSLHMNPERLVCHYCGRTQPFSHNCSKCNGELVPIGAGTQRIEEELREIFPDARIGRLDSDNSSNSNSIIKSFAKGDIDILVGTQIVAKGFDFPKLSLVGIIQADNILAVQDFRADERAAQLLEQFKGRSGRRGKPGTFVIQTREPEHPVFSQTESLSGILAQRQAFEYPPFTRLVNVMLYDTNLNRLIKASIELNKKLISALPGVSITGPYEPSPAILDGMHIRHIRISLPRDRELIGRKERIKAATDSFTSEFKYAGHIAIDVDPV